jgi:RNA polymerase sigma-70 factor (ECF subfamily)
MSRIERLIEQLYRERYSGFVDSLTPVAGSRDRARDVVQEAFARALRESKRLRREESLAAWVWRIAFRLAVRERRRPDEDELPESLTILHERRDPLLANAVRSLPPKRRLILFLRYYAEFTYPEIAEAVGVAEGTVAATLAQAHAALLDVMMERKVAP